MPLALVRGIKEAESQLAKAASVRRNRKAFNLRLLATYYETSLVGSPRALGSAEKEPGKT